MYDEYQINHIKNIYINKVQNKEKQIKTKKEIIELAFKLFLVSILVAVIMQYIIDVLSKVLQKQKLSSLFNVTYPWQVYYAAVIAGGINGILLVLLPGKLFAFAAIIVATLTYEVLAGLTGLETLNPYELIESIIRDTFLILLILYIINRLTKNTKLENVFNFNKSNDIAISDLFVVTLISSIVINTSLFLSRMGYNQLFNKEKVNVSHIPFLQFIE